MSEMGTMQLPEGYKVFEVEFVKRGSVLIAAKSRADAIGAADCYDVKRDLEDDGWEEDGAREATPGDGESLYIAVKGKAVDLDKYIAIEQDAGRMPFECSSLVPEWMRPACSRYFFGRGCWQIRMANVSGDQVIIDGRSALWTGTTVEGADDTSHSIERIAYGSADPVDAGTRFDHDKDGIREGVWIGSVTISAHYYDMVMALYPTATPYHDGMQTTGVVFKANSKPVAVVMPFRN